MTSDIIPQLSYTIPLNGSTSYTSDKVIAGQYSAITVSVSGDQDTTVTFQYSNDGMTVSLTAGTSMILQ